MEEYIARIQDPAFRARFVHEYDAISRWSDKVLTPGARILDFGCGQGIAALGFALRDATAVVSAIDVGAFHDVLPGLSQRNLGKEVPGNLHFHVSDGPCLPFASNSQDLIYSWSVFEHIRRDLIPSILGELRRVLKADGHLFIQIDPLYFSPKGAHLYNILDTPWVHLLDQYDVLRDKVLTSGAHKDTISGLIEQYDTLNRITADELIEEIAASGFEILKKATGQTDLVPPARLCDVYRREVLVTNTVHVLASSSLSQPAAGAGRDSQG